MCGICGKINWRGAPDPEVVGRMNALLAHRGPDAGGLWTEGPVALGHRRLSIIDTSAAGTQPLHDRAGRYVIVFNGEIYNFQDIRRELAVQGATFATGTDTEVILEAYRCWGVECLARFVGMFAFALWDRERRTLFLARDRLGKKPLYYAERPAGFVFASETKALLADPEIEFGVDPAAFGQYLSLNYTLTSACMLRGVKKLPPGHWMLVSEPGTSGPVRYWNLADAFLNKSRYAGLAEAGEALQGLFADAVRLRMISDVPLGAFLSGGVDSSSVVAHMRALNADQGGETLTFSIGFREKDYDELREARFAADALGSEHTERVVEARVLEDLAAIAYHADEPLGDTSIIPMYHLARMTRERVTVALSGDGADEIFAGYETYVADRLHHLLGGLPGFARAALRGLAGILPVSHGKVSADYKIKRFCTGLGLPFAHAHCHWRTIFDEAEKLAAAHPDSGLRDVLADPRTTPGADPAAAFAAFDAEVASAHYLDRAMYVDIKTWLADDILVKVDRSTMAHGLEARAPYLDHRVVEFAAALPPEFKLKGFSKKHILRKSLRGRLPDAILDRKKAGFNSPISHWLHRDSELLERALESNRKNPFYDEGTIRELAAQHARKERDNSLKLFNCIMFHLWHDAFAQLKAHRHAP
ncbi:MAG: asparagine synthase (glutamine-hydrolyzing) [Desulfovibrionaceae bacterium]|jgi:asparagine synthase (glutamine-hydrolysing)|nr:asparagine synthase (glutamine-hydrolyzing) [Desulfovibrionaceae bacterium]